MNRIEELVNKLEQKVSTFSTEIVEDERINLTRELCVELKEKNFKILCRNFEAFNIFQPIFVECQVEFVDEIYVIFKKTKKSFWWQALLDFEIPKKYLKVRLDDIISFNFSDKGVIEVLDKITKCNYFKNSCIFLLTFFLNYEII